ncbi:sulfotransferase [Paenibacillus sp. Marseille-Q4541]|uniref:sulfotransferase family protein n=1 Tax=Paenibacillus sp. Marseille-Q4541 TaxID=2831522 RepID=UPI001BAD5B38|nr:sulfotransferase [Paenibacillus sp. Marseille-Q4541]
MKDFQDNQLIFLLCTPRSGSSLATAMIQNHTEVYAAQEMWYLLSLADLKIAPSRPYGGSGIVKQFYNGILPPEVYHDAARAFASEVYGGLMEKNRAKWIVDKSPRYYILLEFLDVLFPGSRRIGLFRNPLAVAASYKKVNRYTGDPFSLVQDLNKSEPSMKIVDLTVGLFRYYHYFKQKNDNTYILKYEDMAMNPSEELRKICCFTGIPYKERMERYGDPVSEDKADLFYSMGVGDPFLLQHKEAHGDSIDAWKTELTIEEIDTYCRVLGAQIFTELGYSTELAEAEQITGQKYQPEPDQALMQHIEAHFTKVSGYHWQSEYETIHNKKGASRITGSTMDYESAIQIEDNAYQHALTQISQLETRIRLLENRLSKSHTDKKQLEYQLNQIRRKVNKLKSLLPFGNKLASLVQGYLGGRREKS